MIVPIEINTSDILSQFNISDSDIKTMLNNIAKSLGTIYVSKLQEEVSQSLHSTKRTYLESIRIIDSGPLESTILLDYSKNSLVRMIEEGVSAFDIKSGILASPKVRISKTGKKYLSIPMRWSTPNTIGESDVFSSKMPTEVYNIVRQKTQSRVLSGGGTSSKPLSFGEIPSQFQQPSIRNTIKDSVGNVLFQEYQHKSSIYEGMVKQKDSSTGQSTYHTFRRVSESSDPDSFIHTGLVARNLMKNAYSRMNLDEEVGIQIDNELAKLGF